MKKNFKLTPFFAIKISGDLYLKYKTEDIPDTVVLRKYIYPVYPISRTTLNTILNTPIDRELNKLINNGNDLYKKLSQRDYSGRDSDTYAQFLQTIFYHIQGNNETDLFFKLIRTSIRKK